MSACDRFVYTEILNGGSKEEVATGTAPVRKTMKELRADTKLAAGLSMQELFAAIEPHVLGMNRLVGTYSRPA